MKISRSPLPLNWPRHAQSRPYPRWTFRSICTYLWTVEHNWSLMIKMFRRRSCCHSKPEMFYCSPVRHQQTDQRKNYCVNIFLPITKKKLNGQKHFSCFDGILACVTFLFFRACKKKKKYGNDIIVIWPELCVYRRGGGGVHHENYPKGNRNFSTES